MKTAIAYIIVGSIKDATRKVAAFPEQNMKLCIQVAKLVPKNAGIVTCQIFLKKCPKMPYFGKILAKFSQKSQNLQKFLRHRHQILGEVNLAQNGAPVQISSKSAQ